ncbi:YqjF family protein [Bacillus sp. AK031]
MAIVNSKGDSNWVMTQSWDELLFLHWEVPADILGKKVPPQLQLDTYQGKAWLGIVPFAMNHIRAKGLPEIPFARSFLECNVRTYVTYKGEPGVYFFSLDANHALAVEGARKLFSLPYVHAEMSMKVKGRTVSYRTRRTHRGSANECLEIDYTPGKRLPSEKGSLTEWLTERYCLWTVKDEDVYKGEIAHDPWELYEAKAHIREQSLWPGLQNPQHVCYSSRQKAYIWRLQNMSHCN